MNKVSLLAEVEEGVDRVDYRKKAGGRQISDRRGNPVNCVRSQGEREECPRELSARRPCYQEDYEIQNEAH